MFLIAIVEACNLDQAGDQFKSMGGKNLDEGKDKKPNIF